MTDPAEILDAHAEAILSDPLPPDNLFDLSLGEAFERFVVNDARFWDAIHMVGGLPFGQAVCQAFGTGVRFPSRSGFWPVHIDPHALLDGWFGGAPQIGIKVEKVDDEWVSSSGEWHGLSYLGVAPEDVADLSAAWDANATLFSNAETVISRLVDRFLAPLKSGAVVVFGRNEPSRTASLPILPAIWSIPSARIDVINSSISEYVSDEYERRIFDQPEGFFRYEVLEKEFSLVTLCEPVGKQVRDYFEYLTEKKVGRPSTQPWDKAFAALMYRIDADAIPNSGWITEFISTAMYTFSNPKKMPDRRDVERMCSSRLGPLWTYAQNDLKTRRKNDLPPFLLTWEPPKKQP